MPTKTGFEIAPDWRIENDGNGFGKIVTDIIRPARVAVVKPGDPAADQNGLTAGPSAGQNVHAAISNHERAGQVDIQFGRRREQHAGLGFPTRASDLIFQAFPGKAFLRMMRTEVNPIQQCVLRSQQRLQLGVHAGQVRLAHESLGDRRLVRHHDGQILGAIDSPNRLGCVRKQPQLFARHDRIGVEIENPVPVQEHGSTRILAVEPGDPAKSTSVSTDRRRSGVPTSVMYSGVLHTALERGKGPTPTGDDYRVAS